jgi:ATP-dependent DNA helicase DinG
VENTVNLPLARLFRAVADRSHEVSDESMKAELADSARRIETLQIQITAFLSQSHDDSVYWVERSERTQLQLYAAPIEVAPHLRTLLFRPDQSLIMTSATLSVGHNLDYFKTRIGGDSAQTLKLDSPFDFQEQMKIYIPKQMPEPAQKQPYEEALVRWIHHFIKMTHGKAFVLFTSYQSMQSVASAMEPIFAKLGLNFLMQGGSLPRHRLLKKFKEDTNSVLFGTDSFWQGVDVPGEALSNVILTRLPFAVPDQPLTEAKLERILMQGGDPFREYSLPEAILKFRQGVGRLIRTKQDKGIIVILDNRILTKPYGKAFLAVLPECPVEIIQK